MTQEKEMFDTASNDSILSGSNLTLLKVAENNCVLYCAKNYLDLPHSMDSGNFEKYENIMLKQKLFLPSDLMAVEQGVSVLCSVYTLARKQQDKGVCADIDNQLRNLSSFYWEKLVVSYFSASDILFDASNLKTEELEQVVKSKSALEKACVSWPVKEACISWPLTEEKTDLSAFFEKVDTYAEQFGIKNSVYPEKRSVKSRISVDLGLLHQRAV